MSQFTSRRAWPWLAVAAALSAAALQLRGQGRLWWCSCGRILLWSGDTWSADNSQHLFDPYSITHVLHGFAFCALLAWAAPRMRWEWRLCWTILIEALWEIVENTDFVIRRYREATAALGYTGDTVVNSLGDILACGLGFLLARRLGFRRSLALFALTELALIFWIRDSLILNIIMLLFPSDSIRAWQAGH